MEEILRPFAVFTRVYKLRKFPRPFLVERWLPVGRFFDTLDMAFIDWQD